MATLNGNSAYLAFAGVNLSGYFTDQIDKNAENEVQEITAGAGATHKEYAPGLNDNTIDFSVVYDAADFTSYRAALVVGTEGTLSYGPEGQVVGKPRHEGTAILKSVKGPTQTIDKQKVKFDLSFQHSAAPTHTIEGGSTY